MNPQVNPIEFIQQLEAKAQIVQVTQVELKTNSKDNSQFVSYKVEALEERLVPTANGGSPKLMKPFDWGSAPKDQYASLKLKVENEGLYQLGKIMLIPTEPYEFKAADGTTVVMDRRWKFVPKEHVGSVQEYVPKMFRRKAEQTQAIGVGEERQASQQPEPSQDTPAPADKNLIAEKS